MLNPNNSSWFSTTYMYSYLVHVGLFENCSRTNNYSNKPGLVMVMPSRPLPFTASSYHWRLILEGKLDPVKCVWKTVRDCYKFQELFKNCKKNKRFEVLLSLLSLLKYKSFLTT